MEICPASPELLAEKVTAALTGGATLGSLIGYSEQEYEAVYTLGHNLYSQARYDDAIKVFAFLIMNNPLEMRFVNAFAACQQMLKRFDEAIAYYSLASVMDMQDPRPTFHTAECLIALGRLKEASAALGFVIAQSERSQRPALKLRAQTLLDLLGKPQTAAGSAQK